MKKSDVKELITVLLVKVLTCLIKGVDSKDVEVKSENHLNNDK